ncbi:hypothetical protein SPONL_645 [uncultured Candidatus Thioglobus sp.]|nr:hypothetical protein SPONL_645 [uncultured Candidatus Thioglobus sp.]
MKLVEVLLAARSVSTDYQKLYNHDCPVGIFDNGIQSIVEKQTDQKISIKCLAWSGSMFAARLDRYGSESHIWYSAQLNSCWSRFYIAKELVHVLCGDTENFTKKPLPLIDSIISGISLTEDMEDCKLELQAFYGAIELLLPEHLCGKLYELSKNNKTNREIAEEFYVPEKIIEYRLSEAGRDVFDQFKNDV